jgi:hypothetical protein
MTTNRRRTVIPPTLPTTAPATTGVPGDAGPGNAIGGLLALAVCEGPTEVVAPAPKIPCVELPGKIDVSNVDDDPKGDDEISDTSELLGNGTNPGAIPALPVDEGDRVVVTEVVTSVTEVVVVLSGVGAGGGGAIAAGGGPLGSVLHVSKDII